MNNVVFILSHQDDEFGVFESIKIAIQKKRNIYILYVTSGVIKKSIPKNRNINRDKESLSVLIKLGVKKKNIIFLGRENNIPTCYLHNNLEKAYKKIKSILNNLKGNIDLITHAYEGGNEDHDSCNIIVVKLIRSIKKIKSAYQFPLYNAQTIFYYSVQKALKVNGKIIKIQSKLFDRIRFIFYLFHYKSQLKVWVGLYPFLIFNLLFRNYYILQKINKNFIITKPHKNKLLYEKFRDITFSELKLKFSKFLKNY
jgi:LmbE family N-acetylglucosaminyl deacetylase